MTAGSIHLATVRIRKLATAWDIAYEPSYGGCRSWLNLQTPPLDWYESSEPVIAEPKFSNWAMELEKIAIK
jgi:hypothetical protein